jgi:hypothetical protein
VFRAIIQGFNNDMLVGWSGEDVGPFNNGKGQEVSAVMVSNELFVA